MGTCIEKGARSFVGQVKETVVSRSSRHSGHDRRVRCICYYETRPFCTNRKLICDFLLVINSNLPRI